MQNQISFCQLIFGVRSFGSKVVHQKKREMYPCMPEWQKVEVKDPFDYKLRSKEEVIDEFKYLPAEFLIKAQYKRYTAGDMRENNPNNRDNRERVAKLRVDMRQLSLAPLQRQRFQYLLGPRFDPSKPHTAKIVIRQYNTFQENFIRANETLRELYWESKRAPDTNITMIRNPYRREFLIKKYFGKTAEERRKKRSELKSLSLTHKEQVDKHLMAEELALSEHSQRSTKRREFAAKRTKLGFKDQSTEVDDPVLEQLEFDDSKYQKQLKESRERKPVKIVSDVQGIGKDEYYSSMLQDSDKFKDA